MFGQAKNSSWLSPKGILAGATAIATLGFLSHKYIKAERLRQKRREKQDVYLVHNSLLYGVDEQAIKMRDVPPIVVLCPMWLEQVSPEHLQHDWGQTPLGLPLEARQIFRRLYTHSAHPDDKLLTWQQILEIRQEKIKYLKAKSESKEIVLYDLRSESVRDFESKQLLCNLESKNGNYVMAHYKNGQPIFSVPQEKLGVIYNFLDTPRGTDDEVLVKLGLKPSRPHTELYCKKESEVPKVIVAHGPGLSAVWLRKHFPTSALYVVGREVSELPDIPSNAGVNVKSIPVFNKHDFVPLDQKDMKGMVGIKIWKKIRVATEKIAAAAVFLKNAQSAEEKRKAMEEVKAAEGEAEILIKVERVEKLAAVIKRAGEEAAAAEQKFSEEKVRGKSEAYEKAEAKAEQTRTDLQKAVKAHEKAVEDVKSDGRVTEKHKTEAKEYEVMPINIEESYFTTVGYRPHVELTKIVPAEKQKTLDEKVKLSWVAPRNIPVGSLTHRLMYYYYHNSRVCNALPRYELQFYFDEIIREVLGGKLNSKGINLLPTFFDNLKKALQKLGDPLDEKGELTLYVEAFRNQQPSPLSAQAISDFREVIQEIQKEVKKSSSYLDVMPSSPGASFSPALAARRPAESGVVSSLSQVEPVLATQPVRWHGMA